MCGLYVDDGGSFIRMLELKLTLETQNDFSDGRLSTLSFFLWPGQNKIHHINYEKDMRNQTLVMELIAMGNSRSCRL